VAENALVLGWSVPAEIDHSKTRLVRFSDVYCSNKSAKLTLLQKLAYNKMLNLNLGAKFPEPISQKKYRKCFLLNKLYIIVKFAFVNHSFKSQLSLWLNFTLI
jgi:hypothetical protein